ncbi:MAG TPA: SLBB domain-containing protein [Chitinophagaceae bacterium]|nr:SLBB domain-containing protein [Chitinophagaceae bacterium]
MSFPKETIGAVKALSFLLLLSFFTCIAGERAFAQEPTDVPDLPIDPNALKNATPAELQDYLRDNNSSQQKPGQDVHKTVSDYKSSQVIIKDSTRKDEIKEDFYTPDQVYGSGLFKDDQIVQLSQLSTPPSDYPIGVGDHIVVSLWGGADFEEDYEVARDGSIFPQGLGKITVQGLTFENARKIVYDRFRKVIPPSTNVSVTLGQPRSIVVQTSGEVKNPGPQVVSAFTNVLNVVALAGGLTRFGNIRNILISRNGKVIDSVDVYQYLTTGDFGKHLYLENNDFVIVPFYEKQVLASGQFKRPMYYQLKKDEGMLALIKYTGGFSSDAYRSGAEIIRSINERQTIKNVNFNALGLKADGEVVDEPLYDGDVVVVNPINSGLRNKVIVKGAVAYPNVYEVRKGDRLFDVINRAGGITPDTYLDRAYVYKGAGDSTNLISNKIVVNLSDLNKNLNSIDNIPIDPNDVVEVFNKNQFRDKEYVSIEGEVRKPGQYTRYGGMSLKDLLYFANGLKPSAEFGQIVVSSVVNIDSSQQGISPTQTVIKMYSINANLELDSTSDNVLLKPYDQVFVRRNPTFHLQENVKIEGEVKYPGTYSKLADGERLSSFIERSGGLNPASNEKGAILYRLRNEIAITNPLNFKNATVYIKDSTGKVIDSIISGNYDAVSIDLARALDNKGSKYDLALRQGDLVYIPKINPVVTITGAVQSQLKIYFDKDHSRLGYYIDKAGGFGIRPWRKRIFVTYANGRSKRTHNFGFLHFYPRVDAGSTIVVPPRPEGKNVSDIATQALVTTLPLLIVYFITKL